MTWWTENPVPNPVTIYFDPVPDGYYVDDDGGALPPELVRDAADANAAAVQRMAWYTLQGLAVNPWVAP